jgi:hypothetical protein
MALNPTLSNVAANAEADAACALANTGWLRIYDGTQPANADTAVSTQNILAELRFGATAFGASVAGVATANAITADPSANATGTATWFRVFKSDGTTALWDGSVGTATANLILDNVSIVIGGVISVTAFTFTASKV